MEVYVYRQIPGILGGLGSGPLSMAFLPPVMDILAAAPFSRIIEMYPVFHEMDVTHFTDHMNGIMRKSYPVSRLKVHRINNSMSPEEFAEASGVALSEILLLEEKERDINGIAAIDLLRFSRALHCRMEDLIEL